MIDNIVIRGGQFLKGDVVIPPSKSLSHRAIIAAGLSQDTCQVDNIIQSQDIKATSKCMENMGAVFQVDENTLTIKGVKSPIELLDTEFDCHESGSTLRFMIPIAMLAGDTVTFKGRGKLTTRPLDPFFDIFDEQGLKYDYKDSLPLEVTGSIKAGVFNIRGDISSQFITGLMYTLPLLKEKSIINITTPLESKGYLDLTMDVLKSFGVTIENKNYKQFVIEGNQVFKASNYRVEGDFSQVAFWIVAGLLNGDIKCLDMNPESSQGDKEVLDIVTRMLGQIKVDKDSIHVKKSDLKETLIDGSQCPDIIPVLSVLASVTPGVTRVINAKRLRIKECDRLHAMTSELNALGADIEELEDGMIIRGVDRLKGGKVKGWNDHRIVMSMAVASMVCDGDVYIEGCQAIDKSYPHFFEQFKALGGTYNEWHMEK